MKPNYLLLNKSLFLPEQGILVIGDLHLGYESMLLQSGIEIPFNQLKDTEKEMNLIIQEIKSKNLELKKIILLGDIKHYFKFDKSEKFEIRDFLKFLEQYLPQNKIILIKGNHERFELDNREYKDFYIEDKIAFTHGDKLYPEILDKNIKTIVISHLHPAITLEEGVKREKYKCYLIGKYQNKSIFILPSFIPMIAGTEINEDYKNIKDFSIISKSDMKKLKVFVIGDNGKVFEFGRRS